MEFIKSFNRFNNFKFELVENKSSDIIILENKDQAFSILKKKGVSESDPTFISLRKEIEKIFKNINYLGLMTKYIFEQDVSFQEIKDLLPWLKFNGNRLPNNPLGYKKFEDIKDDTIKVDNNQRVKVIYNLLPSDQKKLAKKNPEFYEKALAIHKLGMIENFGRKLSAQKTKEDLINYMDDFIGKNSRSITFGKISKQLRSLNSEILIEDPDTGILIAEILDYKTSKSTGSPDWCIVTGESSWNSYTTGTKRQFFLWDFSENITSSLFMVGFTTNNIGQITNIHDKYDSSLKGNVPYKIKSALKSIDLSTDPFEYKDKIMTHISNGLATEIEYPDEDILILRVKKSGFSSFSSEGWGGYSPFPYGDKVVNFYFYIIYNFKYPLNDEKFCYGIESSDDGDLILIQIIDNLGNKGFMKKSIDSDIEYQNVNDPSIIELYPYMKPKDIEDIVNEEKDDYLNKIERYIKGSEDISSSYFDKKSEYINTSNDPGSTGDHWLFKIENDDLDKFSTDIMGDWSPQRGQKISNFNLYCLIDLNESFRSPTFIRFIKLSEKSIIIKYNIKEGGKVNFNDVSDLSEDLQELINEGHMVIKSQSEYNKEYFDAKKEIFDDAELEYLDDDVDLLGKVLFDYLIDNNKLDLEDYGGIEEPYKNVLIPRAGNYGLQSFIRYNSEMITSSWGGGAEWSIATSSDAEISAQEYCEQSLDELGLEGISDWVWKQHIDIDRLVSDYVDDSYYFDELIRDDLDGYDITKIQKDGVESNIDNSNEEVDSLSNSKDRYEKSKEKTEERLDKFEEFIESKLEKIDELQSDEIDDNDPDKKRKFERLEGIKKRIINRSEVNKKRYEDLIEKYENVIIEIENRIEVLEDKISEMEDEDNEDYWEYDESEIELKIQSLIEDSENEIRHDPIGYLEGRGFTNNPDPYGFRHGHQTLNDVLRQYIDFSEVAKLIIESDGRGSTLSGYDGIENEHYYDGTMYYIYQQNN